MSDLPPGSYTEAELLEAWELKHPSHLSLLRPALAKLYHPDTSAEYHAQWLETLYRAVTLILNPSERFPVPQNLPDGGYERLIRLCLSNGLIEALMRHLNSRSSNTFQSKLIALAIWNGLLSMEPHEKTFELGFNEAYNGLESLCKNTLIRVRTRKR